MEVWFYISAPLKHILLAVLHNFAYIQPPMLLTVGEGHHIVFTKQFYGVDQIPDLPEWPLSLETEYLGSTLAGYMCFKLIDIFAEFHIDYKPFVHWPKKLDRLTEKDLYFYVYVWVNVQAQCIRPPNISSFRSICSDAFSVDLSQMNFWSMCNSVNMSITCLKMDEPDSKKSGEKNKCSNPLAEREDSET